MSPSRREPGTRDYRDLHKPGEKSSNSNGKSESRWWNLEGQQCAAAIGDDVEFLKKNQSVRLRQHNISERLYGNYGITTSSGSNYTRLSMGMQSSNDRVTYNVVQSTIDTLTARVGETKPRPYYVTSGGNYKQQRKAKNLNTYVEGVFYENKTYDVGLEAFRDAAITGDGFVYVYGSAGRVCHERVLPNEIWVDEVEGLYGKPRNLHRMMLVDRDQLAAAFPEKKKEIFEATRAPATQAYAPRNISDMLTVIESWHLASKTEDGEFVGGKHAIALTDSDSMLLEPEEWGYDFFPFARISWCKKQSGYWAQGLAEQLRGNQIHINKMLWLIQRSMHLAGSFKVFLQNGSKVVKESISNEIGAIVTYTGAPPTYLSPQPIHEVYFQEVEREIERCYRISGLSELTASSKKPMGLNSGVALRNFEDIESDRHRTIQRQNDNLYLQIASLSVVIAKELAAAGKMQGVRAPGRKSFNEINFKRDIGDIRDDDFVQQCFPVSRLPRDPSGRLQTIQEYVQAGFMTPRQARRALDFPDLDAIESLANAQEEIITMTLDKIVYDGKYNPPQPTDDLSLCKELVIEYIQHYRTTDLEEEKLNLLRTWNSQVDMLSQMAAPPPVAASGGAPQAAPMPQPQSDLIANVPTSASA